jgi:hypothetical protein
LVWRVEEFGGGGVRDADWVVQNLQTRDDQQILTNLAPPRSASAEKAWRGGGGIGGGARRFVTNC